MTEPLAFSVVICAYTGERWNDLVDAVKSVQAQTLSPLEIIIVIDHNPELFARVRHEIPDVRVVENHEPRGLGGARNSGVAAARGDVVAFLDDDAEAVPEWLQECATQYEDPKVLGVGGAIQPRWMGAQPGWFPEEFNWVVGCSYKGMPTTTTPVRNVHGCNMSFRREVFDAVGTFRLGYGCDETEFCIRLHKQRPDGIILYAPQARVYHRVPASRASWRYLWSRCFFEGRSKAVVAWIAGTEQGLAAERAHVLYTLPRGILSNVAASVRYCNLDGIGRAVAIVTGLICTTAGYIDGSRSVTEAARERGWYDHLQIKTVEA